MSELVDDHLGKPLKLYIYNCYFNSTREVTIIPNRHWGGQGSLGCGIGFGALHRLPQALNAGPPPEEGQTLFDAVDDGRTEKLLTGAEIALQTVASDSQSGGPLPVKAKRKTKMKANDIEAILAEGSKSSTD